MQKYGQPIIPHPKIHCRYKNMGSPGMQLGLGGLLGHMNILGTKMRFSGLMERIRNRVAAIEASQSVGDGGDHDLHGYREGGAITHPGYEPSRIATLKKGRELLGSISQDSADPQVIISKFGEFKGWFHEAKISAEQPVILTDAYDSIMESFLLRIIPLYIEMIQQANKQIPESKDSPEGSRYGHGRLRRSNGDILTTKKINVSEDLEKLGISGTKHEEGPRGLSDIMRSLRASSIARQAWQDSYTHGDKNVPFLPPSDGDILDHNTLQRWGESFLSEYGLWLMSEVLDPKKTQEFPVRPRWQEASTYPPTQTLNHWTDILHTFDSWIDWITKTNSIDEEAKTALIKKLSYYQGTYNGSFHDKQEIENLLNTYRSDFATKTDNIKLDLLQKFPEPPSEYTYNLDAHTKSMQDMWKKINTIRGFINAGSPSMQFRAYNALNSREVESIGSIYDTLTREFPIPHAISPDMQYLLDTLRDKKTETGEEIQTLDVIEARLNAIIHMLGEMNLDPTIKGISQEDVEFLEFDHVTAANSTYFIRHTLGRACELKSKKESVLRDYNRLIEKKSNKKTS